MAVKRYLFFVLGATNVGKSTFLTTIQKAFPADVHLVEVGKRMREKYPAGFFKGMSWMPETEFEVMEMLFAGITAAAEKRFVFVDGQPRNSNQARQIYKWPESGDERTRVTIELVCPWEIRWERAEKRDITPEAFELTRARFDKDILQLHEVMMSFTKYPVYRFDTSLETYTPEGALATVLKDFPS